MTPVITKSYIILTVGTMLLTWQKDSLMSIHLSLRLTPLKIYACTHWHNPRDLQVFTTEAMNCTVLDSACSSTVCGRRWLEGFLDSLNDNELEQIKSSDSDKVFRFGCSSRLLFLEGQYELPATLAGEKVKIKTDVVSSDIPILLSKTAMKKAHMKLDLVNDTAEILGKNVSLNCTSPGHYCVPISQEEMA